MPVLLLLLLDTVPSDIDIGDNDSDTASQEATPTSSLAYPPEHATSFLPGSESDITHYVCMYYYYYYYY